MATGYGKYTPEAYGKAYANQQRKAYQGTKGKQNLGVSNKEILASQGKGKGGCDLPFGALGGSGNNVKYTPKD